MGWSGVKSTTMSFVDDMFQSLRGFGVGWSVMQLATLAIAADVSIPERVWGGLERR